MKPMLKYRGGKSRELEEIKKFIPSFEGKYIDMFLLKNEQKSTLYITQSA